MSFDEFHAPVTHFTFRTRLPHHQHAV